MAKAEPAKRFVLESPEPTKLPALVRVDGRTARKLVVDPGTSTRMMNSLRQLPPRAVKSTL